MTVAGIIILWMKVICSEQNSSSLCPQAGWAVLVITVYLIGGFLSLRLFMFNYIKNHRAKGVVRPVNGVDPVTVQKL